MKTYYEILEVDKNASDEIIKVAYKSLVKKYHPDLKEGQAKIDAESKIKEINEEYDILSDPMKKMEYDQKLINQNISREEYNFIINENNKLKKELNYFKNNYYSTQKNNYTNYSENINNYYSDYKNIDYTNKTNSNSKNIFSNLSEPFKTIIAFLLTFLIIFIILKIPFIRDWIIDFFGNGYIFMIIIIIIGYIYFFRNKK